MADCKCSHKMMKRSPTRTLTGRWLGQTKIRISSVSFPPFIAGLKEIIPGKDQITGRFGKKTP